MICQDCIGRLIVVDVFVVACKQRRMIGKRLFVRVSVPMVENLLAVGKTEFFI